jgi:hypothetical protein
VIHEIVSGGLAIVLPVRFRGFGNEARGRIPRVRFPLVLGLALMAGCDRRPETGRERVARWEHEGTLASVMELGHCTGLPAPAPEWRRHHERIFVLQAPPEYRYEAVQGTDSYIGQFHGPGREFGFDYGSYSGTLLESRTTTVEFRACRVSISGHPVRIVTARSPRGRYLAGATWREIGPDGHAALTISGTSDSPAGQRELLAIFRSVRLTPPAARVERSVPQPESRP